MCGIVGAAGNLVTLDLTIFNQLLFADTLRGVHSTGVAAVGLKKEYAPNIIKEAVTASLLQEFKGYSAVVNTSAQILIGHNRHATLGKINKVNSHPFFVDDSVVGCHNGTLERPGTTEFIDDFDTFGTDSEAALNSFATRGAKETLENIVGAWAFVWYDYQENQLRFARNDQRPLAIAVNEEENKIFWASEAGLLRWILGRNGLLPKFNIMSPKPNVISSFLVPDSWVGKFEMSTEGYEEKPSRKWGGSSGYDYGTGTGYSRKPKEKPPWKWEGERNNNVIPMPGPKSEEGKALTPVPHFSDSKILEPTSFFQRLHPVSEPWVYTDFRGNILTAELQRQKHVEGKKCITCGTPIQPNERWRSWSPDLFMCPDCAESDDMKNYINATKEALVV